jgi:uncharacterized protein (TIGR03437 family)
MKAILMARTTRSALVCLVGIFAAFAPAACVAQTYTISTLAGGANPYFYTGTGDGGQATSAGLANLCYDVAVDAAGNLYIVAGSLIRKVTPAGIISTVAGGGTSIGDYVPATTAEISPIAIASDAAGDLYIADTAFGDSRIRKVDTTGTITTVAGGAPCCTLGDGGPATSAYIGLPNGVAVDAAGNLYIAQADSQNNLVRKVSAANGTIATVAGGGSGSGDGGQATTVSLAHPTGVAVDLAGNLYIAEANGNRVRKVSSAGIISTVAGNGSSTNAGDGGPATQAGLDSPWHVAVDTSGNLYITQINDARVRLVTSGGTITTIAGTGVPGFSGDGGPATSAELDRPAGITVSGSGAVYIADATSGIARVRLLGSFSTGPATISITTTSLSNGTVLTAGSQTLTATGGTPPYTWTLVGGSLPPGLGLSSAGVLSGTPTTPGSYTFTVKVTDAAGASAVETVTLSVAAQSVTITTPSPLPSGMVTVQYPQQVLTASGGYPPYTFSVPANSLPSGLTLNSGGAISGTPTVAGSSTFTLTATDSTGQTGTASISLPIRPFSADLITSSGSLSFALAAGATTLPLGQTVQVESTDVTKLLSYSTTITPPEPWLSITPGDTTPGAFTVSLTSAASSLAASATPYHTAISVACMAPSPCAGSVQSVSVSVLVSTVAPELTALTDLLSFTTPSANAQTTTQSLGLQNAGGGSITVTAVTCGQPFCSVGAAPATLGAGATGSITVQANPAGLSAGYYFTAVTIVSSAGTITVPVTFLIAGSPSLVLEPAGVLLTMPAGGVAANPNTSFLVAVTGSASPTASVAFTAALLPGAPWLNLATTSGTSTGNTPGAVSYSINQTAAAALASGAYYGTIRISAAGAMNTPQDFQVVLNVTAANAPPTPNPTPGGLIFLTSGATPAPQIDQVFASSVTAVAYQASAQTASGGSWLSVSPATGTTSASAPAQTSISVNPAGLAAGVYRGSVSYSLAAAAVPTVNVTLVVESGEQSPSQRTQFGTEASAACTPTQIIPTQTGLVSDFAAPASWPTPLEIQLNDNCGNAVSNGQVTATFSNGDPPLALSPENTTSGLYSATWTPRATGAQVVVTATAMAPGFATATTQIAGAVAPNVAPTLNVNGTLDAFAIAAEPGVPIAPGSIVAIYGSGLAGRTVAATALPLQTNLGGTSVIIGGIAAPLYFVSVGQVNAQVPFELAAGQPYALIVSANNALTTPQTIQLSAVTPGIAAYASGYAIAQHVADSSLITDASPAKPDEYVVIYLAGMGPTTVPVASGAVSPSSPLAYTSDAPTVTLNGETVSNILFSGLTPTLAGLYQIDLQVPMDAPNGDLTLTVTQTGFQGTPVILPVHN